MAGRFLVAHHRQRRSRRGPRYFYSRFAGPPIKKLRHLRATIAQRFNAGVCINKNHRVPLGTIGVLCRPALKRWAVTVLVMPFGYFD
jgi:hypothetical protein